MALSITGTGNGSLNNLALSANTGTIVDTARAGGVIQMVNATTQTNVEVTTATYTDSGLSASITPTSSSNKILIMIDQSYQYLRGVVDQGMGYRLLRDSTVIHTPPDSTTGGYWNYIDNTGEHDAFAHLIYLDSPATTSSVTYKTQGRPYTTANTGRIRFQVAGTNDDGLSSIILMEVVA